MSDPLQLQPASCGPRIAEIIADHTLLDRLPADGLVDIGRQLAHLGAEVDAAITLAHSSFRAEGNADNVELVSSEGNLASRLFAAFMSYQLGLKNIDNVMKQYAVDTEVGDTWIRIAKQVEASYVKSMGRRPPWA